MLFFLLLQYLFVIMVRVYILLFLLALHCMALHITVWSFLFSIAGALFLSSKDTT